MARVDVLLPTCERPASLVMTLAGLAAQSLTDLRVVIADQGREPARAAPVVGTLCRVIEARGGEVEWHERPQVHGVAEQRDFLLARASAAAVLFLDDDVLMEGWVLEHLLAVLEDEGCGFVGAFPTGLSYRDDVRPRQQVFEPWEGPVRPETVEPGSPEWERAQLHRAANLFHVAERLPGGAIVRYKVAWIASCILYDRDKLVEIGGFSFWDRLPRYHSGEEVLVQNLLMRRWGGCAIAPSGTYHAEVGSTVLNEHGGVDGHALDLLDEMVARYCRPRRPMPVPGRIDGSELRI